MSVTPPARDSNSAAIDSIPQRIFLEQLDINERTLAGSQTEWAGAVKAVGLGHFHRVASGVSPIASFPEEIHPFQASSRSCGCSGVR
jgi:hypothetical protein